MRHTTPVRLLLVILGFSVHCLAQPELVGDKIRFTFPNKGEKSVSLVGDFNGWSKDESPLARRSDGQWEIDLALSPGIFQYKFVVNGGNYELDARNPAVVDNYNNSAKNSVFVLTSSREVLLTSVVPQPKSNRADEYTRRQGSKPVYLNIIWHQHQPLYVNPETDQLSGPWVRTHATKDYYDMAAMLRNYADVHCTINLTSSLLHQLQEYYVVRLKPYVDTKRNRVDIRGFFSKWKGKTDPWIDLALTPTREFGRREKSFLYLNAWNAFGITELMLDHFPEYRTLRSKLISSADLLKPVFTEQEMREIKFWFYLAHFDPDFLKGAVRLPDGSVCDLSDLIGFRSDNTFYLKKRVREYDCQRMVAEAYKVMANVIPVHKSLRYDPAKRNGQIEIITTPYYHPILPLIYDSDLARICQPGDQLPTRFSYPQDANAQVAKAVKMFRETFGWSPSGMWPGEGSVAQPVLSLLRNNGILWTASDVKVLARSDPPGQPNTTPYKFNAGDDASIVLTFRDTELSDHIGFRYQNYRGEDAAEDFVQTILARAPKEDASDVLITVILDGENAWEWYKYDIDGKEFLNALYRKLSKLFTAKQVITTTPMEYLYGNTERGILPHSVESLPAMGWLWPGSWINSNYDTWIGEPEENRAWEYLFRARKDLESSGIPQPDPFASGPKRGTKAWNEFMAWESMYAAEGSDWFWWFGNDQTAPGGDKPFDDAFRTHLRNMYKFANLAGAALRVSSFDPIITAERSSAESQGVMAQSHIDMQRVLFTCDASSQSVSRGIFIAGNLKELGMWVPNAVAMYDDGTHGDVKANDALWSLELQLPVGGEVFYKYTNSGERGQWVPGEEFPSRNRRIALKEKSTTPTIIKDIFGKE